MEVLNFSSKRGQNEIYSDFAEREKIQGLKNLNVPTLRFSEFTEDWVQYKISNICKIATGNKNTQDKEDDGIYPFYVRSQNVERINSWTFDGEAILTAGDGVGVGKVFHYSLGKIGVHQRVYILSDFNCYGKFLYNYFSSRFYNRVKRMSAKNSVDSVRMEMIADMPISIPNEREQIKIGELLSLLDERIATQNKIIQQLQSLIKGIYDKAFEDISDYQKLSSVCTVQKGQQVNGEELSELGDYYVMNGGIEPSGYYDRYNTYANTISISEGGNSCGYVQYNNVPFWSGGHCYTLQNIKEGYHNLFLYHYLKAREKEIIALRIGSGLSNIQKKDLEKFIVPILPLETQVGIVDGINKIETKLKQEKDMLLAYQKQKAYLLSNLFI